MFHQFTLTFVALFVALDIVGVLPMYMAMIHGLTRYRRNRVVDTSMLVAFLVALVFVLVGRAIFRSLGITLYDFRIAGGLVLLLVSLSDLANRPEAANRASGSSGIVPLAVPLITGPAVLTTLILQVDSVGYLITLAALAINYLFAWFLLRRSELVTRIIGKDGTVVISKIAALLLAAIAISMIRGGIFESIAFFRHP